MKPRKYQNKKREKGVESRQLALRLLIKIEAQNAYSNIVLAGALAKSTLSRRDRAFVTCLVQGVTRNKNYLDHLISRVYKRPPAKLPPILLNTLRLGIFQLEFLSNLPSQAVISTSTSIARNCGHEGLASYTTAVLNKFRKENNKAPVDTFELDELQTLQTAWLVPEKQTENDSESLNSAAIGSAQTSPNLANAADAGSISKSYADSALISKSGLLSPLSEEDIEELSLSHSMPEWIVVRWLANYGLSETLCLLEHSQSPSSIALRVNDTAITREGLIALFKKEGIKAVPSTLVPSILFVVARGKQASGFHTYPGYEEGLFSIQDQAAALVCLALSPKKNELIVDLCAAPGGKTLHISEVMENTGRIIAVDKHESRLDLLKSSQIRLGLTNIEIRATDGLSFRLDEAEANNLEDRNLVDNRLVDSNLVDSNLVDRVLVDAPCTGTGVLNRRPDLRYRRRIEDLELLSQLQLGLLNNASRLLKPGGVLVYSTCSVEQEENQAVCDKFLAANKNFRFDDLFPHLSEALSERPELKEQLEQGWIQILPSMHGLSGFFIARFVKTES
ncbi:MAG: hypothetical protein K8F91_18675 [Candidatus Obscuribacterales bacterium]|nr:hypothetical protein [Candidatus Obscuribacterales bacterium]